MNSHLNRVGCKIQDLYVDLRDGKMLIKLLEVLSGERLVSTLNSVVDLPIITLLTGHTLPYVGGHYPCCAYSYGMLPFLALSYLPVCHSTLCVLTLASCA